MNLYFMTIYHFFFVHLFDAVYSGKRTFRFPVKKGKRLNNSYNSIHLTSNDLVMCGLLCTEDVRCSASSLSKSNFLCEMYNETSTNETADGDKALIYQRQATQPLTWPAGNYTLMKPLLGCPGNTVNWKEGSRFHDSEDDGRYSTYVVSTNMSVSQDEMKNIRVYFCTKDAAITGEINWPVGNYCILKYGGDCPTGFIDGYISWDDEDTNNANQADGTLPKGVYTKDTFIYYCCRDDGNDVMPIALPTSYPFYLLRYTGNCQSVKLMSVVEETIEWDCEDNGYKTTGTVSPFEDGPLTNIKLHFCYYYP